MIKYWYKQKKKREKVEKGASDRPENDTVSEINKIKEKLIRVDKDSKGGRAPLGHASSLSLPQVTYVHVHTQVKEVGGDFGFK